MGAITDVELPAKGLTVPASERTLQLMVKAALPVGAQFGRENFAGDPIVQEFFEWAKEKLKLNVEVFVSWSCPPDVSILTSPTANILLRNERFDTLLIEYSHLKDLFLGTEIILNDLLITSQVLRWMAEFLLSFRWPEAALYAAMRAQELRIDPYPPNPFRDEILTSVRPVERAAMQCFCLAHELGHLVPSHHDEATLNKKVDGVQLSEHITRDIVEAGAEYITNEMIDYALTHIDVPILMREIDADLIALELVAVFIAKRFDKDAEAALSSSLSAYEAQSFLYATKNTCLLLKRYAWQGGTKADFTLDDWVQGVQISVRARCVLRRAGILLSRWCAPNENQTAATINRYVPIIDAMFFGSTNFRADLAVTTHRESEYLFDTIPIWNSDRGLAYSLIETAQKNSALRLDLFYMMVAMGFSGGTDPIRWFEYLFECRQLGRSIV